MMSSKLKSYLCSKLLNFTNEVFTSSTTQTTLLSKLSLGQLKNGNITYFLPLSSLESFNINKTGDLLGAVDIITSVSLEGPRNYENIVLEINTKKFMKEILEDGLKKMCSGNYVINSPSKREKIVIDYSSLNIAKPFHMGHLRSTIIGNFIANVQDFLGNDVVRINYLGDWGTQFGLLLAGIDMLAFTDDMIKQNPTRMLYKAYVAANQAVETNPDIGDKAREIFQSLEEGSSVNVENWETFRSCTVKELEQMYRRLNVRFDVYEWESAYSASRIGDVLKVLEDRRVIQCEEDGRKMAAVGNRRVPVVKSDGTTLYLTRDIAAAMHRHTAYNFDQMLYVVDSSQSGHFTALFSVLSQLGMPWSSRLQHVRFGRIQGMSTRKGSVVFLTDILDEARDLMHKKQQETATTKVDLANDDVTADVLGVSAVIVNDLKQRRKRDYLFDWDQALQMQGDTGVKLQYAHCRLCSLEKNCGVRLPSECDPTALLEPQAIFLVQEMARFEEVVLRSSQELEACILVKYLFKLCGAINGAFKVLQVKNQDGHTASQRLLLFCTARQILYWGMKILGLQPLSQM